MCTTSFVSAHHQSVYNMHDTRVVFYDHETECCDRLIDKHGGSKQKALDAKEKELKSFELGDVFDEEHVKRLQRIIACLKDIEPI